jgi:hypothetical protein
MLGIFFYLLKSFITRLLGPVILVIITKRDIRHNPSVGGHLLNLAPVNSHGSSLQAVSNKSSHISSIVNRNH